MRAFLARRALPAAGGALGVGWLADETYGHRVAQRTARALGTGAYLVFEYKVRWSTETSSDVHARVAKRLVQCLKENEGLYVKFGQALASMDVALPEEYKRELRVLHDQAATFSFKEVRRVVEADLGRPLEEVFEWFQETPVASASIAQVHRARLRQADTQDFSPDVAVKVQKPNIPVQNACDLAIYRLVLEAFEWAFELPVAWTYPYTRRQLLAELDFRVEAANAERCASELEAAPRLQGKVVVPRVHRGCSGQHVLVMEWVDSISSVSDGRALRQAGLDPVEVMHTATEVFGHQIFTTGHVHCDPHPGNLLVRQRPSGAGAGASWQLVLLDHGLYCELPEQLRRDYADFWVSTALGDRDTVVRLCRGWGVADEESSELLASLTQFRRVRLGAGRLSSVAGLFGSASHAAAPTPHSLEEHRRPTPEEMARAQAHLKKRAQKVLADTRAFPQELIFVGRNLNMIRSANFALGRAVNRVAILAECAAAGSAAGGGGGRAAATPRTWAAQQLALLKFHFVVRSFLTLDALSRALHGALFQFLGAWQSMLSAWPAAKVA